MMMIRRTFQLLLSFQWMHVLLTFPKRSIHILEDLPIGTSIYTFHTDGCPTETTNGTYRFVDGQKNFNDFFLVDPYTGRVTTKKLIDREEFCHRRMCSCAQCEIALEVLCIHLGRIFFNDLLIVIDDRNDHSPTFTKPVLDLDLLENVPLGYLIPIDAAIDVDYGKNSIQDYQLFENNTTNRILQAFHLEYSTKNDLLALRLMKHLDRELSSSLDYILQASDGGQPQARTAHLTIHINILDVNDMSPVFDRSDVYVNVSEATAMGVMVARVQAVDRDTGLNGLLNYTIVSIEPLANGLFRLSPQTGELYLNKPLDYEREKSYRIKVKAEDNGPQQGSRPAFATIHLRIEDENDNYPVITPTFNNDPSSGVEHVLNSSSIRIAENTANGTFLVGHLESINRTERSSRFSRFQS